MTSQWDKLANVFAADIKQGDIEGYAADNVFIAWPSILRGIDQTFGQSVQRRVLDFGCGGGLFCNQLAKRGYEVTGYDESAAMVAAARTHTLPKVTVIKDKAVAMRPHTYDVITSCMVLPFIENLDVIAAAFIDALRSEGLIIYATFNPAFITENAEHPFFPPVKATETRQLELKPGVRIPFFERSAESYQQVFKDLGYEEIYREYPAFTSDFLAQHSMPFSTKEPEFLVQGFRQGSN